MKLFAFGIGRLGCVNRVLDLDTYYRGLKNYPCCFLNFACSIMGPRTLFELLRPYSTAHNLACFLRQEMSARDLRHGAYLAGVVQEGLGVQVALYRICQQFVMVRSHDKAGPDLLTVAEIHKSCAGNR